LGTCRPLDVYGTITISNNTHTVPYISNSKYENYQYVITPIAYGRRIDIFFENNIFKDFVKPMIANVGLLNVYLIGNTNAFL